MSLQLIKTISERKINFCDLLAQDKSEWELFIEFVVGYFKNRNIIKPIVVEIGLMKNSQKAYYELLLSAEYIGIDCNVNCEPDILGSSQAVGTMEILKGRLSGRKIDLLFIDGNHAYDAVRRDYELFELLTKHLIVFHDIRAINNSEVLKFWDEIRVNKMTIEFNRYNKEVSIPSAKFIDMGIGVIIKE